MPPSGVSMPRWAWISPVVPRYAGMVHHRLAAAGFRLGTHEGDAVLRHVTRRECRLPARRLGKSGGRGTGIGAVNNVNVTTSPQSESLDY